MRNDGHGAGLIWALMLATVLTCAAASVSFASAPPPRASALEVSFVSVPGIPRNVVASVAQDRAGFFWIGTGDGLARYDGYRLQMIEREGTDALNRNMGWVRAMAADPDGRLWIGTESSGLAVYDPDALRVGVLGGPTAGPQNGIVALALDSANGVWIGTLGGGLLRFDEATARFEAFALPGLPPGEGQALALAADAEGGVWVGHWNGLARWRPGAAALEVVPLTEPTTQAGKDPVMSVLASDSGEIWVGTQRGKVGAITPGQPARWTPAADREAVQALSMDTEGRLWVGHQGGLDLLDPETGRVLQRLSHRADQPAGLAGNEITGVLRDPTGAMWVAGFGVGLQRHRSSPAIAVRGPDAERQGALRDADVRALLTLSDQRVLAATHAGTLAFLDADLNVLGEMLYDGAPVQAMAQDTAGKVWLASRGRIEQRDLNGRRLRQWETDAGAALIVQCDADGSVWLGTERGLLRWQPGQLQFETVLDDDGRSLDREVFALAPDGSGGLLVGGRAGLHQLAAGEETLRPVQSAPGAELGFSLVIGLLRDRSGALWVDTPVAGLHRMAGLNAKGEARFERISIRLGVVGRPFGANLYDDARGRIWSPSFVYDPAADRIDELRAADGAQFGTPWFRSHTRLTDGRLLFGGSKGLMRVAPERFEPSSDQPPLVISGVRVDGLSHRPPSLRQGLVLPPGTRSFGLEFAALEFADPQLVQYRYRLKGYDRDWLPADAAFRSPSYSELPPGEYVFEAQATNRSGIWSPYTLSVPVLVQPMWWQAAWVPWVLGLLFIATVWAWGRWRTAMLLRRQSRLEDIVAVRTAELRQVSLTDPLTGLRNRRYLTQRIDEDLHIAQRLYLDQARRDDADVLVFLIDLDHFKTVNDRYGHAAGDAVLVQTASILRRVFRDSDTLVRWGGEEFLVLARASNRDHAADLAERLRTALSDKPFSLPESSSHSVVVTASIGFVAYPPDRDQPVAWSWDAVLQLADAALYAAKTAGRNGWVGVLTSEASVTQTGNAETWLKNSHTHTHRSGSAT